MLKKLHSRKKAQLILALAIGILFGFLLQKGGVASYNVIIGQLMLQDNTVVKVMLSAVVTGMAGVYILRSLGLVQLHPKFGTLGSLIPGGILFGAGFALLGYCPGTVVAAAGQGNLDAALAGIPGILLGTWLFAVIYPALNKRILPSGVIGDKTLQDHLHISAVIVVPVVIALLVTLLVLLEKAGV